eukprot:gene4049-8054_t
MANRLSVGFVVLTNLIAIQSLHTTAWRRQYICSTNAVLRSSAPDSFDDASAVEFNNILKSVSPVWGTKSEPVNEIVSELRGEQMLKSEQIFRKYPFENVTLPVLPDCNNYYSGKFGEYFWHQNAEQVYVYIPISDEVSKKDIKVDFAARKVTVNIHEQELTSFECMERIIPDGSFWVIEEGVNGQRYIQLDLEKRFRMINWKNLFGEPPVLSARDTEAMRSEMLEKLFAANKGMSLLTGAPPEEINDMSDEELRNIQSEVDEEPRIISEEDSDPKDFIDAEFDTK